MKLKSYKVLLIVVVALCLPLTFSTNAFASGGQCSGDGCSGFNVGGYGNQVTNGSGTGSFAGYSQVRFDAYRPVPGLTECTPSNTDRALYDNIGVPANYSGVSYLHRHVALLRSDINVATNGVEDAKYYNTGLKFNLETGATAPTTNLTQTPTHSNPWIGPNWLGSLRCLPLNGGQDVDDQLKLIKPDLQVNGRQSTQVQPSRVVLRAKKSTIDLTLQTAADASPGIDIAFDFSGITAIGTDENKINKWKSEHPPGEEPPLFYGWFIATDPKSPFTIKTTGVTYNENGTTTFPIKYKKKGNYGLFILASYQGKIVINGTSVALDSTAVSSASNPVFFKVVSVKSASRKS
ncbi:MAG: hypothetical protein U0R17_04960 [Acidimicrobiia bacterium]